MTIDDCKRRLAEKRVVVVGMARTGVAAAEFLAQKGAEVIVTEARAEGELGPLPQRLRSLGVEVETGGHSSQTLLRGDLVVLSPGVDPTIPSLQEARMNRIPIVSEVELASWYLYPPIIAVTGTNGKSTTTALIGSILSHGGKRVFVGGNIGTPLTEYLLHGEGADFIVAEISSFQLEAIYYFKPWIAILLNLSEDHLDRHPSFSSYVEIKGRIFHNQGTHDWAVLNGDDVTVRAFIPQIQAHVLTFGREIIRGEGVWLEDDRTIVSNVGNLEGRVSLERVGLVGVHNVENIMAAVGAATVCGVLPEAIQEALESFRGLEHRLELVGEWEGVRFYDDSKATNVASVLKALISFEGPVILLAGGRDKGGDYSILREAIEGRVKALILMGEAREKIRDAFEGLVPIHLVRGMEEGVRLAWEMALSGDVVLFSPACSSFDMFRDYRQRGETYREIVRELAREEG